MWFLGVDAGGTKTHALLADEGGVIHGVGRAGAGNWEMVGLEGALAVLRQGVGQALAQAGVAPGEVAAAGYGLAGLDWPSDEERLRPLVAQLAVAGPQVVVNDSLVALRAGARAPYGVVLISGTGCVTAGRNPQGQTARTLGLGHPYDDWGSAVDLAMATLHAVARAYTGRGPATALSERLVRLVGARDLADLLEGLSRWRYDAAGAVTDVVRILIEEVRAGDAVACQVARDAGREMASGPVAVIRRLGMEREAFDLVLAGGTFRSLRLHSRLDDDPLLDSLFQTVRGVAPRVHPLLLETPPVVGGVLLAMDAAGVEIAPERRAHLEHEALSAFADGTSRQGDQVTGS